jgi:hypothetical protein
MTAVQANTEEMYIFDRGVDTKFLGVSKSGASIYTGNLLASFCIGSVPNGGTEGTSPHSKILSYFLKADILHCRICCFGYDEFCHATL